MLKFNKKQSYKYMGLWRKILLIVAGLILGLNVYQWNAQSIAGNAMPMPFGVGASVVLSGSMEPTLAVDDLVIIRETDIYRVGDVVVYQSGNILVIHRIIAIDGDMITTKGDANNAADSPINASVIKGKLAIIIPGVGGFVRIMKSLPVTISLLVLIVVLMELSWRKEKDKDQETLESIKMEIRQLQKELDEKKGD